MKEKPMSTVSKIRNNKTALEKFQELEGKLSNKLAVNDLINRYLQETKNATVHILNMCSAVKEMHDKHLNNELNDYDIKFFCISVGLEYKSPTFWKYKAIADNRDRFEPYIENCPSAYTVLYEITQLSPENFELLMKAQRLGKSISLKEVLKLRGKKDRAATPVNTSLVEVNLEFDRKLISREALETIVTHFLQLQELQSKNSSAITLHSSDERYLASYVGKLAA